MKDFAALFLALDRTNKTNEKLALLQAYFLSTLEEDKIWALALFTGRRPSRAFKTSQIQQWALEAAGIPEWLFKESYQSVGDLSETISLILPPGESSTGKNLHEWFDWLKSLKKQDEASIKTQILKAWKGMSQYEIFVFNKLMMGSFRVGVSQTLVVRALADAFGLDSALVSHRLMGNWDPYQISFQALVLQASSTDSDSKPYPFYLAYSLESELPALGLPTEWFVEWKWDGIRSQIIIRNKTIYIWSRGEELVTDKFPELHFLKDFLPHGTVLDGEIIAIDHSDNNHWKPLPFNILQTRIGRKNLSKKFLTEAPAGLVLYDVLEWQGKDIRPENHAKRRAILEQLYAPLAPHQSIQISPLISFQTWDELKALHPQSRSYVAEGFMLKKQNSSYQVGRKKGDWWKWKVAPLSIDAVLIYAQKGHGRRADLYTDYTFAVWDNGKLVSFAKAYSGLTDAEIKEVDKFVKQNTLEKFGPVRTVTPFLVFELGFEGIQASGRHKSGIAVRFPRILRWRKDKKVEEADTLENLKKLLELYG
jgi:DNA ligase-1